MLSVLVGCCFYHINYRRAKTPAPFPTNLPSPAKTPTPRRFRDSTSQEPEFAMQVLQVFDRKKTSLSTEVKNEVRAFANRHNMCTRGAIRGRDISRAAITKKLEEINKLQEIIAALEADRQVLKGLYRQSG